MAITLSDKNRFRLGPNLFLPRTKPIGPVRNNGLIPSLYDFWMLDRAHGLRSGIHGTPITLPSPSSVYDDAGFLRTTDANNGIHLGQLPVLDWNGWTFLLVLTKVTGMNSFNRHLSIQRFNADDVRLMGSTPVTTPEDFQIDWDDGSFNRQSFSVSDNNAVNAIAIAHSGSRQYIAVNGKLIVDSADTFTFYSSALSGNTYIGDSASAAGILASYGFFAAFTRCLPKALLEQITKDPFCMLEAA